MYQSLNWKAICMINRALILKMKTLLGRLEISPIPTEEIERLIECESNFVLYEKKSLELDFVDAEKILSIQRALKTLDLKKKELEEQEKEMNKPLLKRWKKMELKVLIMTFSKSHI